MLYLILITMMQILVQFFGKSDDIEMSNVLKICWFSCDILLISILDCSVWHLLQYFSDFIMIFCPIFSVVAVVRKISIIDDVGLKLGHPLEKG